MIKKIAFIEIDTHSEIVKAFRSVMQKQDVIQVDYYLSAKIMTELSLNENDQIFLSSSFSLLQQLEKRSYDHIIIATMHRHFNMYNRLLSQYNCSIILHNLCFTFASFFSLLPSFFKENSLFRLKLIIKEGFLLKNRNRKLAKNLFVLDPNLCLYNQANLQYLPLFACEKAKQASTQSMIVIAGAVSKQRRDYEMVFKEIKQYNGKETLQIVFLGKASAKENIDFQLLEKELPSTISITYFSEKVKEEVYNSYMDKASFLWCPLQGTSYFLGAKEFYGKSKMTGNRGDCIRYQKIGFFPEFYPKKEGFIYLQNNIENMLNQQSQQFDFHKEFSQHQITFSLLKVLHNL